MRRLPECLRDDRGSTLPLIIFYGALSLVLVLLVVAATSIYLERKRLFTLADGAALVGAEAYDLDDVLAPDPMGDGRPQLELRDSDVSQAVTDYLEATPTGQFEGLVVTQADSEDGKSATVGLSAQWRPPVLTLVIPDGLRIEVSAVARSVFE